MTTIRIGNDIHVRWSIFSRNGAPYVLDGAVIRLWLLSGPFRKRITDYSISENVVSFLVDAKDLHRYGIYKLVLSLTDSASQTEDTAFDFTEVFQIVSKTYSGSTDAVLDGDVVVTPSSIIDNVVENYVTNAADGEDLTAVNNLLKFRNRTSSEYTLGYKILREGTPIDEQITDEDTIYEVRYAFDLDEDELNMPDNCVLRFNGGRLSNGTIIGVNTAIDASPVRIFDDDINVSGTWKLDRAYSEWFGAVADGEADCTEKLQATIDAFNMLNLLRGIYKTTGTVFVKTRTCITGIGTGAPWSQTRSIIKKHHTTTETVDAVLAGPASAIQYLQMRDFAIESNGYDTDYGFYFGSGINQSGFENLYVFKCKVGFYAAGIIWNIRMDYVICNGNTERTPTTDNPYGYASGSEGFCIMCSGGGTTLNMNQCWALAAHKGYSIQGFNYSTLINCGADKICDRPWWFKGCRCLSMIGCAMESCIGSTLITFSGSNASIIGFDTFKLWPANVSEAYMLFASDSSEVRIISSRFVAWEAVNYSVTKYGITGANSKISLFDVSAPYSSYLRSDMIVQSASANGISTRIGQTYNTIYTDAQNIGATTARPVFESGTHKGFQYFDETLGQPIWWTGSAWVDAANTTV